MNRVLWLFCVVLSVASFAEQRNFFLRCRSGIDRLNSEGYVAMAWLRGPLVDKIDKEPRWNLDVRSAGYIIYDSDEDNATVWGKESIYDAKVKNDPDYRPTTYKNHARFGLPFKSGKVEFIFPENTGNKKNVTSYLVLTHIDDHNGGTIEMKCTKSRMD